MWSKDESNLVLNGLTLFDIGATLQKPWTVPNPKNHMAQLIPFAELTGGTDTVRFTVIKGKTYMSVHDIIMLVCTDSKTRMCNMGQIGGRQKMEVATFCGNFKFPSQGQKTQPVITLKGVLKLIEWLPGENAKEY
jgi:hypothetical protein